MTAVPSHAVRRYRQPRASAPVRGAPQDAVFRGIDSWQVLHDHAARPDIHMANLGIAYLAVGKPDLGAGGGKPHVKGQSRRIESKPEIAKCHGCLAQPPAIHDAQDNGAEDEAVLTQGLIPPAPRPYRV